MKKHRSKETQRRPGFKTNMVVILFRDSSEPVVWTLLRQQPFRVGLIALSVPVHAALHTVQPLVKTSLPRSETSSGPDNVHWGRGCAMCCCVSLINQVLPGEGVILDNVTGPETRLISSSLAAVTIVPYTVRGIVQRSARIQ